MQSKSLLKHLPLIFLCLLPIGYLLIIWNNIPEQVVMRFNYKGEPTVYQDKLSLLGIMIFMTFINIGVYLLVSNIHKIDPKRAKAGQSEAFYKIAAGTVVFMSILSIIIIFSSTNPSNMIWQKAMVPLMGALFTFLGNIMYNVKPNYFVGIRIPWTMNDEDNWKKTHRIGGRLWFIGGIFIILAGLALPIYWANIAMQVILAIIVIIPIAYSFMLFKNNKAKQGQ